MRSNLSSTYETFLIDKAKIVSGLKYAKHFGRVDKSHAPFNFILFVHWLDGLFSLHISRFLKLTESWAIEPVDLSIEPDSGYPTGDNYPPGIFEARGGRKDRGDPNDLDTVIHFPVRLFERIGD